MQRSPKRVVFAVLAIALTFLLAAGALLAADVYEHHKMAANAGLNIWGYRGPVVGRKKPGERRVVVVGESSAFGYGVHWNESFPAYLQDLLNGKQDASRRPVSVVNLAYNNEGAHSYKFTLADYAYLDYDAVVFYSGYNDLGPNRNVFRHASPIFRMFGYMPVLPLVMHEKAMVIRYAGRLDDAYAGKPIVFRANTVQKATAATLEHISTVMDSIQRPVTSEGDVFDPTELSDGASCGRQWAQYCGAMYQAIAYALARHAQVLIVTQPRLSDEHLDQQQHLVAFLRQRFGSSALLHFASVSDAINVQEDSPLTLDHMHLTAPGNRLIAERLAEPVGQMIR